MNGPSSEVEVLADGFRRTGPPGDSIRWSGLRDRFSEAVMGQGRAVREGLSLFRSWQSASAAAAQIFPPGALRDTATGRRSLQRSLRTFGADRLTFEQLTAHPRGAPARVRGRILRARKLLSHIWLKGETSRANVRLLFEEGHDFFLTPGPVPGVGADVVDRTPHALGLEGLRDLEVPEVLIIAAGGYLMGDAEAALKVGDWVEVFGFVDRVVDREARGISGRPRGEPLALALRSGDQLPIVVSKMLPETR
jgi:hypothetical protein